MDAAKAKYRTVPVATNQPVGNVNVNATASSIAGMKSNGVDVVFYETIALGTGVQANNPWLQELPDPITRACWDNYITIPV